MKTIRNNLKYHIIKNNLTLIPIVKEYSNKISYNRNNNCSFLSKDHSKNNNYYYSFIDRTIPKELKLLIKKPAIEPAFNNQVKPYNQNNEENKKYIETIKNKYIITVTISNHTYIEIEIYNLNTQNSNRYTQIARYKKELGILPYINNVKLIYERVEATISNFIIEILKEQVSNKTSDYIEDKGNYNVYKGNKEDSKILLDQIESVVFYFNNEFPYNSLDFYTKRNKKVFKFSFIDYNVNNLLRSIKINVKSITDSYNNSESLDGRSNYISKNLNLLFKAESDNSFEVSK